MALEKVFFVARVTTSLLFLLAHQWLKIPRLVDSARGRTSLKRHLVYWRLLRQTLTFRQSFLFLLWLAIPLRYHNFALTFSHRNGSHFYALFGLLFFFARLIGVLDREVTAIVRIGYLLKGSHLIVHVAALWATDLMKLDFVRWGDMVVNDRILLVTKNLEPARCDSLVPSMLLVVVAWAVVSKGA